MAKKFSNLHCIPTWKIKEILSSPNCTGIDGKDYGPVKHELQDILWFREASARSWRRIDREIRESAERSERVKIQELGHKSVEEGGGWASCYVMPDEEKPIGPVIEKTVRGAGIRMCSSVVLRLWDGKKMYKSWYY